MASDSSSVDIRTPRKATVIGGGGFIGRNLVARLREWGWDCHVPGRDEPDGLDAEPGHVFFCAGLTADYAVRPFDTVQAHVSLLGRVLQAGTFSSLVYLSSTRLYDSSAVEEATETTPLLLDPLNPRHIYDLSKALGESLCNVTGSGRARVARLSCVYKDAGDADGFLPMLVRRATGIQASADDARPACLQLDTSASFSRDYVAMEDVLDALVLIAVRGRHPIYNVASGQNVSNAELFGLVAEKTGCRIQALRDEAAGSPARVSIKRMEEEFGWRPVPVLRRVAELLEGRSHLGIR